MQVDNYEAEKFQMLLQDETLLIDKTWKVFSEGFELFLSSFVKAAEEDENFDSEINNFLSQIIEFLEDFELGGTTRRHSMKHMAEPAGSLNGLLADKSKRSSKVGETDARSEISDTSGLWFVRHLFDDMVNHGQTEVRKPSIQVPPRAMAGDSTGFGVESYNKVYAFLETLMRTISIAKAGCTNNPNLKVRGKGYPMHLCHNNISLILFTSLLTDDPSNDS